MVDFEFLPAWPLLTAKRGIGQGGSGGPVCWDRGQGWLGENGTAQLDRAASQILLGFCLLIEPG